jgi:TRAP-type uncharacterized transport system fused permease subunit
MSEDRAQGSQPRPRVVRWFKVFAAFQLLLSLFAVAFSLWRLISHRSDPDFDWILPTLVLAMGLVYGFLYGAALRERRTRWHWVLSLICIIIGMFNGFIAPLVLVLLIFWVRDNTRDYYFV